MGRTLEQQLIKNASFDYWLHNGRHPGKGELQRLIDELPAITNTILQGNDLTLEDEEIIYLAMTACSDLKIMTEKWPARISLMRKHLTSDQITQAESNKSEVEKLIAQVEQLLQELQNAYVARRLRWVQVKESIIRKFERSRRNRGRKHSVEMLLHQLATLGALTPAELQCV